MIFSLSSIYESVVGSIYTRMYVLLFCTRCLPWFCKYLLQINVFSVNIYSQIKTKLSSNAHILNIVGTYCSYVCSVENILHNVGRKPPLTNIVHLKWYCATIIQLFATRFMPLVYRVGGLPLLQYIGTLTSRPLRPTVDEKNCLMIVM